MRLIAFVSVLCWSSSAWAGIACFEKASGRWLGEYCTTCDAGTCVKNWVTNNPQLGYTANQIEERQVTVAEGQAILEAAEAPRRAAREATEATRQALLASASVKLKALGLTDDEVKALMDAQ